VPAWRVTSAGELLRLAGPLLRADELRHSIPLGVLATIERDPDRHPEHHFWVAEEGGVTVACGLITPPFRLLVAGVGRSFDSLVAVIRADGVHIPGVTGFVPEVEELAACWSDATGDSTHVRMSMRMYATDAVRPVPEAPGRLRAAVDGDRPLLRRWAGAFVIETGLTEGPEELIRSIDARVGADPGIVLWEVEGVSVSLAGANISSPGIARIGPVYTPPEHRRHGYASSLVAAWTSELLRRGMRRCALFTDLANPTSNSIYRALGYRAVAEGIRYEFDGSP
jgi:GNAT superfamily N-acetyltransferase